MDLGSSRPWPLLIAPEEICTEICSLESNPEFEGCHELFELLHDIGWAFEELKKYKGRKEGRDFPHETSFNLDGGAVGKGQNNWENDVIRENLSKSSIEALIAFSVGKGWWATSRLFLDLVMFRQEYEKKKRRLE